MTKQEQIVKIGTESKRENMRRIRIMEEWFAS